MNPRYWTPRDVAYLERRYGLVPDEAIGRRLGRSVDGVRMKAKKIGIRKCDLGFSARDVAGIFGVDSKAVGRWIDRDRVLPARRGYRYGPSRVFVIEPADVERFIREHGEYVDLARMPDSPYRDLALQGGRWYGTVELQRLTGRHSDNLSAECAAGIWPARRRGAHWRVHESWLPAIRATAGYHGRLASWERRERTLEHKRNVRKGIEEPRGVAA